MKLAAAPISWGVSEVPGWGVQLSAARVLGDARRLGFAAIEAGPPGFLPDDAVAARELLARDDLRLVAGFVTAVLHDRPRQAAALDALGSRARWLADAGAEVLVLAASTGRDDYEAAPELSQPEWSVLVDGVARASDLAAKASLTLAVHPHVGTVIERQATIERLLETSDVPICLDAGHAFVGGADPTAVARAAARRIRHVHLKDADPSLATQVRERRIAYATAVAHGLYRPLGDGAAGIAALLAELRRAGYEGWYVLEQDIALTEGPGGARDPALEVARSRDFALAHA